MPEAVRAEDDEPPSENNTVQIDRRSEAA
jgi:hypothetical protein